MNLITQCAASKLEYAPSKAYLSKIAKKPNRPLFFVPDGDHIYVDTDNAEWQKMIGTRKLKKASGSITGGNGSTRVAIAYNSPPKSPANVVSQAKPSQATHPSSRRAERQGRTKRLYCVTKISDESWLCLFAACCCFGIRLQPYNVTATVLADRCPGGSGQHPMKKPPKGACKSFPYVTLQ